MSQPLTIQVPEDLYIPLQALAQQSGKTPEEFTLQWLKETIQKFENDYWSPELTPPPTRLAGNS
jgi:hypothetical protein